MVRQVETSVSNCIVLHKIASQALNTYSHGVGKENEMLLGQKHRQKLVERVMVTWRKKSKAKQVSTADDVGCKSGWRLSKSLRQKEYAIQPSSDDECERLDHLRAQSSGDRTDSDTGVENIGNSTSNAAALRRSNSAHKIVVAVTKNQGTKDALKWAIANFIPEGGPITLVHVRPPVRLIPTPLGTFVPVEQVSAEIASAYIKDANAKTEELLLDHQWICDVHKVDVDFIIIESFCVEKALVDQVSRLGITKLILGSSSRSLLARKLRRGISGYVAKNAPKFCAVLVVSKGKLLAVREAEVLPASPHSCTTSSHEVVSLSCLSGTPASSPDGSAQKQDTRLRKHSIPRKLPLPPTMPLPLTLPRPLPLGVGRGQGYLHQPSLHRHFFSSPAADGTFPGLHKLPVHHTFFGPRGSQLFVSPFYNPSSRHESAPMQSPRLLSFVKSSSLRDLRDFTTGSDAPQTLDRRSPTTFLPQRRENTVCDAADVNGGNLEMIEDYMYQSRNPPSDNELSVAEIQPATSESFTEEHRNRVGNLTGFTFNFPDLLSSVSHGLESPPPHGNTSKNRDLDEVDTLRLQLAVARIAVVEAQRHARIQALRCKEAVTAALVARQKERRWAALQEQEMKLRELACREAESAERRAGEEARKRQEAVAVAERARHAVEAEMQLRKEAEANALKEMDARNKVSELLKAHQPYREYSYEELRVASNDFSPDLKLGEGGYGVVYQGKIHHTTVAIKVLNPGGLQGSEEFQREVELLRRIHHPHMVMLLGCCPDKGCLVYEYMANGSLEDCLLDPDSGTSLLWYTRFRIAAEVATALLFLHSSKPVPIVHRDLKPANILLDRNFVSKIGDVGLARLVPTSPGGRGYNSVFQRDTTPVGTFAYIDPEYQRTGSFGPKSDVYALGIVLLQLLTGRQAVGIAETAEVAIEMGDFEDILDRSAGKWPVDEALGMARLALQCAEMKRKNRPELDTEVMPFLAHCRQVAEDYVAIHANRISTLAREQQSSTVPTIFLCPILQEVMLDPVIAADGHTYDSQAIRLWLESHETSPMTNLKLAHRSLTPNHAIRSAIREWQTNTAQEVCNE